MTRTRDNAAAGVDVDTINTALDGADFSTGVAGDILYHNGTSYVRLAKGANGSTLGLAGGVPAYQTVAHFTEEQAGGTAGKTLASSTWDNWRLNTTIRNDIAGCSLASEQITLPAGTYRIEGWAGMYRGYGGLADVLGFRVYDVTNSATLTVSAGHAGPDYGVEELAWSPVFNFLDEFTLAGSAAIELQGYANNTGIILGRTAAGSEAEMYANVRIVKVA